MNPYLEDPDFILYVGDSREVLSELEPASVDCCVTSPPYWGLRDYGTGQWAGGNPDCDHTNPPGGTGGDPKYGPNKGCAGGAPTPMGQDCSRCGASRVDRQIGLEATPEQFVAEMVAVFREVRRVLTPHGTLWLNLGDSYAGSGKGPSNDRPRPHAAMANVASTPNRRLSVPDGIKQKDLVGIPWRVAFALQADGWYLRADIIWSKPNPMPESVTDRPTKAHEYVFLLSKQPRYFFDQEAAREKYGDAREGQSYPNGAPERQTSKGNPNRNDEGHTSSARGPDGRWPNGGRNVRSVWELATQPYPDAHFATFPEALPERCIKAGCPVRVCVTCGKASERILKCQPLVLKEPAVPISERRGDATNDKRTALSGTQLIPASAETIGWTDCGHDNYRTGVVLDPFMGSGTVALVARRLERKSIGIELNEEYAELAARRLQQLSLFAHVSLSGGLR